MSLLAINLDLASLLVFILSLVLSCWLIQESKLIKYLKTLPGPKLWPIIGNGLEFQDTSEMLNTFSSYPEKYGNRVRIILGKQGLLFLFHPNDLEKLLSSPALTAKADIYKFLVPWLGTGTLVSKGQRSREQRKLYTPLFFHYKILETFNSIFNEQSQVLVDIIKEQIQGGESEIKMHGMFIKCTLDIICETAFGKKLNSQRELNHPYADAIIKQTEYVFKRIISPWLHPDLLFKYSQLGRKEAKNREFMQNFVMEVVHERKLVSKDLYLEISEDDFVYRSSNKSNPRNFCVLDAIIQMQGNGNEYFTDTMIRDEMSSIIFAGHDTTASNLIWTLFLIATNQDVQKTVQEELDTVFGGDKERAISSSDLVRLNYLECCIKESLRLYPSGPLLGRNLEQDLKLDDGVVLPKGLDILISPYVTQRLAEFYPDPLEFQPLRWLPENSKGRHPYAFIPFSAGAKGCLGVKYAYAENKMILAYIFRNFQVQCLEDPSTIVVDPEIVIRPKGDIQFSFAGRE